MTNDINSLQILDEIRRVLSMDLNCARSDLSSGRTVVCEARYVNGRRCFPFHSPSLTIVTMGNGAVISCDPSRLRWAQQHLEGLHRDELFAPATIAKMEAFVQRDGQSMAGPDLKYFCARSNLCSEVSLQGISFELLRDGAVSNLYNMTGFSHALQYRMSTDRPDVLACVARVGDSVVGVAGASADCDTLWQIGIDVLEQSRRQGIGKALLTRLTQAVLDAERLPYYSTVSSNIASCALAINVGYRPVWIEMYAR